MTKGELIEQNPFLEARKVQNEFQTIESCSIFSDLESLKQELVSKSETVKSLTSELESYKLQVNSLQTSYFSTYKQTLLVLFI